MCQVFNYSGVKLNGRKVGRSPIIITICEIVQKLWNLLGKEFSGNQTSEVQKEELNR